MGLEKLNNLEPQKDELLEQRLRLVVEQDNSLEILGELGKGDVSTVYNCNKNKDGVPKALKVSRKVEGIDKSEILVLNKLAGVSGIPKLLETYKDKEIIIALLLEKIKGKKLQDYFSPDRDGTSYVIQKIEKLIGNFHARGFLMPKDWLKEDNWLVTENNQPYLLDLGESQLMSENKEEAGFQIRDDLRSFYNLIHKYLTKIKEKDKKIVEDIILRNFNE